jgi:hypothetical protein
MSGGRVQFCWQSFPSGSCVRAYLEPARGRAGALVVICEWGRAEWATSCPLAAAGGRRVFWRRDSLPLLITLAREFAETASADVVVIDEEGDRVMRELQE